MPQRGMPFPCFIGYNERQLEETMSFASSRARSFASRAQSPDGAGSPVSLKINRLRATFRWLVPWQGATPTVFRPVFQAGRWNPFQSLKSQPGGR
jgi:hypothetical protein